MKHSELLRLGIAVIFMGSPNHLLAEQVFEAGPEIWIDGPGAVQPGTDRDRPHVATDEKGRRIYVWDAFFADGGDRADVFLRRFDADGNPLHDPADGGHLTATSATPLTPDYASPEQLRGEPATTATDIYQLGILLYRLLTGELPHRAQAGSAAALGGPAAHLSIPKPSTVVISSADPYTPANPILGKQITVVEALDLGVARLETSLPDRPAVRAAILSAISDVYQDLGSLDRALPLRVEALNLQESLYGPTSREARDSLGNLAIIHAARGELEAAAKLHEHRLMLALDADPQDEAEIEDARYRLGRHLIELNLPEQAESYFFWTSLLRPTRVRPRPSFLSKRSVPWPICSAWSVDWRNSNRTPGERCTWLRSPRAIPRWSLR